VLLLPVFVLSVSLLPVFVLSVSLLPVFILSVSLLLWKRWLGSSLSFINTTPTTTVNSTNNVAVTDTHVHVRMTTVYLTKYDRTINEPMLMERFHDQTKIVRFLFL
jgi:hypothetical protein